MEYQLDKFWEPREKKYDPNGTTRGRNLVTLESKRVRNMTSRRFSFYVLMVKEGSVYISSVESSRPGGDDDGWSVKTIKYDREKGVKGLK